MKSIILDEINKGREKVEAAFVFGLWNDPDMYEEYKNLNKGKDHTLQNDDAIFYFNLGREMFNAGYRSFDNLTVETFLDGKDEIRKKYEKYGGYREIEQLRSIADPINIDANFDQIIKTNMLGTIFQAYTEKFKDLNSFDGMTSEDVYNIFELINANASINTGNAEQIDDLIIGNDYIEHLNSGEDVGFQYAKYARILNSITLGAAAGSLYMIGAHSGVGKSSFAFEVMLMGLHYAGIQTAIISNEMLIDTYKNLLLEHILTRDLNYWDLTRKRLRQGNFTREQLEILKKAARISSEQYSDIHFVKLFDNDIGKIQKYMRRLKAQGVSVILYDTFKSDDSVTSDGIWQSLMLDARKLFQTASRLGICCVTTYQLALYTENQRFLSASCLSNSKQIKEIYETMIYMRPVWQDEYPGCKYDIHPYSFKPGSNYKVKEDIHMDPDKKYMLVFVDKTRADEDKQIVLFEWNARFNKWTELGYAKVVNDHGGGH